MIGVHRNTSFEKYLWAMVVEEKDPFLTKKVIPTRQFKYA